MKNRSFLNQSQSRKFWFLWLRWIKKKREGKRKKKLYKNGSWHFKDATKESSNLFVTAAEILIISLFSRNRLLEFVIWTKYPNVREHGFVFWLLGLLFNLLEMYWFWKWKKLVFYFVTMHISLCKTSKFRRSLNSTKNKDKSFLYFLHTVIG